MALEFPFNRRNRRRRSAQPERIAEALLNSANSPRPAKAVAAPSRARKATRSHAGAQIQSLEERLLLAANINLATWAGTPFLLEASGNGVNATLTLKNRTTNVTLDSVTVDSSDTVSYTHLTLPTSDV